MKPKIKEFLKWVLTIQAVTCLIGYCLTEGKMVFSWEEILEVFFLSLAWSVVIAYMAYVYVYDIFKLKKTEKKLLQMNRLAKKNNPSRYNLINICFLFFWIAWVGSLVWLIPVHGQLSAERVITIICTASSLCLGNAMYLLSLANLAGYKLRPGKSEKLQEIKEKN